MPRRHVLKTFGVAVGGVLLGRPLVLPEDSRAAPAAGFTLPWGGGERRFVLQGQNQGSHTGFYGRYAWDFARAPFDSTVYTICAAREGVVKEVVENFDDSPDCDFSYNSRTNYVFIDHGDGYGSVYMHVKKDGVFPRVGQRVDRGEPIALTGHTGFLCGTTHQHFTIVDAKTRESLDVPFLDADTQRSNGRPQTNEWYWAGTPPPAGSTPTPTPATPATPSATATPRADTSPTPAPNQSPTPSPTPSPTAATAGDYQARLPWVTRRAGGAGHDPEGDRAR